MDPKAFTDLKASTENILYKIQNPTSLRTIFSRLQNSLNPLPERSTSL
jgi:hypothetical protein